MSSRFSSRLRDAFRRKVEQYWYASDPQTAEECAWNDVFEFALKKRQAWLTQRAAADVPVIVVGNITVGGAGKTPLVIEVVNRLKSWGARPAVVSRGYGTRLHHPPVRVSADSLAQQVGDEPLLIAQQTQVPVVVDPHRVRAVKYVRANTDADMVVSDDGLQHYRMQRCFEIAVVDGERGFGNGRCLPLGPLREPVSRLHAVDMVVVNGGTGLDIGRATYQAQSVPLGFRSLHTGEWFQASAWPRLHDPVVAVAGIGYPERFFATLRKMRCACIERPFADHHRFVSGDFADIGDQTVVMTAKDAVKVDPRWFKEAWVLEVRLVLEDVFWEHLKVQLQAIGVVQATPLYTN